MSDSFSTPFVVLVAALLSASACQTSTGAAAVSSPNRAPALSSADIPQPDTSAAASPNSKQDAEPLALELSIMSRCPFSATMVRALHRASLKMGTRFKLAISYVGNVNDERKLTSMRGEKEVLGDIAQLCAAKKSPDKALEMIVCQSADQDNVDKNWKGCAAKIGIPIGPLEACVTGSEGQDLAEASFRYTMAKKISGTPTFFIAGTRYDGVRTSGGLARALCRALGSSAPSACTGLPPAPPVTVTVLNDRRCTECQSSRAEGPVRVFVENRQNRELDYSDPEGKKLFELLHLNRLPALVFDETLQADPEALEGMDRSLKGQNPRRYYPAPSDWNPACEDKGACSRADCKDYLPCHAEKANRIELYTMALCPYCGTRVQHLQEALKGLERKIVVSVQFIGTGDSTKGFSSIHGPKEVEEDLRHICAAKHYAAGNKFLEFMACRAADSHSANWESCTGGKTGFDAAKIRTCAEGPEGKKLLEASFRHADAVGIHAAPTFVFNDKFKTLASDPTAIKNKFCEHNRKTKGCE